MDIKVQTDQASTLFQGVNLADTERVYRIASHILLSTRDGHVVTVTRS